MLSMRNFNWNLKYLNKLTRLSSDHLISAPLWSNFFSKISWIMNHIRIVNFVIICHLGLINCIVLLPNNLNSNHLSYISRPLMFFSNISRPLMFFSYISRPLMFFSYISRPLMFFFYISRPLMLNTQRLSSLAFNLRDGLETDQNKLTESMKRLSIRYSIFFIIRFFHLKKDVYVIAVSVYLWANFLANHETQN